MFLNAFPLMKCKNLTLIITVSTIKMFIQSLASISPLHELMIDFLSPQRHS